MIVKNIKQPISKFHDPEASTGTSKERITFEKLNALTIFKSKILEGKTRKNDIFTIPVYRNVATKTPMNYEFSEKSKSIRNFEFRSADAIQSKGNLITLILRINQVQ